MLVSTWYQNKLVTLIKWHRNRIDFLLRNDHRYWKVGKPSLPFHVKSYNKYRQELRKLMAKKSNNERAKFVGFVNVHLTVSDKKQVAKILADGDASYELIDRVFDGAYDVKLTYNHEHSNFNCSIMTWNTDKRNAGKIVSSFGNTWHMALVVCAYKVLHILGDSDWIVGQTHSTEDFG